MRARGKKKHERGLYWRRVRRRMVGATFFFLLIAMVWQLGSYSRPPAISPVAPSADSFPEIVPNETMQATDRDLRETESAFEYEELNPTFSASTEPPSAPAAAIEESAEESAEESPEESPEKLRGETPEKLREESPEKSPEKLRGETPESEVAEVAEVTEDVAPLSADDESDFFVTEPFSPFAVQIGAFKIKKSRVNCGAQTSCGRVCRQIAADKTRRRVVVSRPRYRLRKSRRRRSCAAGNYRCGIFGSAHQRSAVADNGRN